MYNSAMLTRLTICLGIVLLLAGCRSREVEKDISITDIHSGWYDVGVVDGQNKLVPSITLRLQNVSSEPISRVQINAVFRRVGEAEEWLTVAARDNVPRDPLSPGDTADFSTIIFRVKGSDLAGFRAGRMTLEEARQKVEVREY